jgi:hypothetical protein
MEILEGSVKIGSFVEMQTVDCQGFQLSRYAAELAERHGIDVRLIKMNLDLSPRQRLEQAQEPALVLKWFMEAGKRIRHSRKLEK